MAEYTGDVNDALKAVDGIYNSRDLAQFESILRSDPFADGPEWQAVFDALGRRERDIARSEAEANRAARQEDQRAMRDALSHTSVKGSGIGIKKQGRGGRLFTPKGIGLSVPSGSSESLAAEGSQDGTRTGIERFKELAKSFMDGNYVDPTGKGGGAQVLTHDEVVDKLGIIPPDAGRQAIEKLLMDSASDASLEHGDIDAFAKEHGLPKSAAGRAHTALRKAEAEGQGPTEAKQRKEAKSAIVGSVIKDAHAQMKSLEQLGYLRGLRDAGKFKDAVQGGGLAGVPRSGGGGGGGNGPNEPGGGASPGNGNSPPGGNGPVVDVRIVASVPLTVSGGGGGSRGGMGVSKEEAEEKKHENFAKKTLQGAQEHEQKLTEAAEKRKTSGAVGNGFEPFMAARLFDNFSASVRAGLQIGNAAGAVAQGAAHLVLGAAGAFVHAGESALGLFLSPFGKTGGAFAHLAGAVGQSLLAGLTAGGGLAVAGIKLGVGLVGGIIAGGQSLIGGALGAVLGAAGGVPGMLAGAVIGTGLVARIQSVFAGVLTTIGGAVGQALGAIGTAFGELGSSVGAFLSSVKDVLSDLIETGVRLGQTALATQRQSGMSAQASSDAVGLSQVLTGGPGAFSAMFGNVSMMKRYMGARDEAYGAKSGGSFVDNLPGLFQKYQAMGGGENGALRQRIMLSVVAPGAQDAIGGLFSLGKDVVAKAVSTAKAVALSPAENKQNALLGFDLNVVQAQLDRLKTRLLSDLMPALTHVLGVFTNWFTGHEGAIIASLEKVGRWVYVMLPEYFRRGANAFFELGKAVGDAMPGIAAFIHEFYAGFAYLFNGLKNGLAAVMIGFGGLIQAVPGGFIFGQGISAAGAKLAGTPSMNPDALDGLFKDDGVFGKNGALYGPKIKQWASTHEAGFDKDFEKSEGSIASRNKSYDGLAQYFQNNRAGAAGSADINLKADITVHPDEDSFARFERRVGDQTMKRLVRADQRS